MLVAPSSGSGYHESIARRGRPLCETVHAAGPNDGPNFQVKITSRPNGLIGGTSCPRRRSHQTLTRHQGDPEPSGHSEAFTRFAYRPWSQTGRWKRGIIPPLHE